MLQRITVLVDFAEFNPGMSFVHCLFPPFFGSRCPALRRFIRAHFEALYREHRNRTSTAVKMPLDGRDGHHHTEG